MPNALDPLGLFDAAERDARRMNRAVELGVKVPGMAYRPQLGSLPSRPGLPTETETRQNIEALKSALSANIEDERKAQRDYSSQLSIANRAYVDPFLPGPLVRALRETADELEEIAAEQRSHELRFVGLLDHLRTAGG